MKRKSKNFIAVKSLCIGLSLCCMASGAQAASNSAFEKKFDVQFSLNQVTLKNVVDMLQEQTDIIFSSSVVAFSILIQGLSLGLYTCGNVFTQIPACLHSSGCQIMVSSPFEYSIFFPILYNRFILH